MSENFSTEQNIVQTFCRPYSNFDYVYLGKCVNYCNFKHFTAMKAYENARKCDSICYFVGTKF